MGIGEQVSEDKHQKRETYEKFFQYSQLQIIQKKEQFNKQAKLQELILMAQNQDCESNYLERVAKLMNLLKEFKLVGYQSLIFNYREQPEVHV